MIQPPRDWQRVHGGALVWHLLDRIDSCHRRIEACRAMVWTYFDLLNSTYWRNRPQRVEERPAKVWRVNDGRFVLVPSLTDEWLLDDAEWRTMEGRVYLVVAPHQNWLLRCALEKSDSKPLSCEIRSVDDMICFRTGFMPIEMGWSHTRVNWELMRAYNNRVALIGAPRSICFAIPRIPDEQ